MKVQSAIFEISAGTTKQFPPPLFPEVVFAGRSNVGKSSLLNALTGRSKLAKVSSTPGKTRLINFFLINSSFRFVDLPGYGFAHTSATEQNKWRVLMESYFRSARPISLVLLLIDSRIPIQKSDLRMFAWMNELNQPLQIVLTKIDKLKQKEASKQRSYFIDEFYSRGNEESLIEFSSVSGTGRERLGKTILDSVQRIPVQSFSGPDHSFIH